MSTIKELSAKSAQTTFDKKVLTAVQHLHPYVKHRIYIAESTGILPKNMYSSNGIIDECIITLYSKGFNIEAEYAAVRLELFKLVDNYMNELFKKEVFHKNTISTDEIRRNEIAKLGEEYTIDADLDLILNTELNDISYRQDMDNELYLYEDKETSILRAFELENLSKTESPKVFSRFYNWLPINISNIVDLYIFGNLEFDEIAKIKNITTSRIELIFDRVKKSFRSHLE
ncbi:MAG: hypothetical protein CMO82_06425 [Winogradskyella sp.]|mgnify:FL=1|uniref:Sigma-70 family RNA polymerase sigma factor n=1 Tax=Winogradskyella poriferorum TaxID=307627 RepID=A0ABU7W5X4_9FLAO|nr:hypothetical protein [Winogradskyella sp.]|tara:strand:+ start:168 stop:857 length:690 start_codon:yes stop_codon:yes gene_type:complete